MKFTLSLTNIQNIAQQILEAFSANKIFAVHGNMGAGKTTLINNFCKILGVKEATSSPTYSIIAEYVGNYNNHNIAICHMDWYRLKNAEDIINAGVIEYINNNNYICFVEWSSIAPQLLPKNTVHIQINIINETEREIIIT